MLLARLDAKLGGFQSPEKIEFRRSVLVSDPDPAVARHLSRRLPAEQDLAHRGLAVGVHTEALDIDFVRWRIHVNGMDIRTRMQA
jgi:hypothetical protein